MLWLLKSLEMQEVLPPEVCFLRFRDAVSCVSLMLPQKVQLGAEIKMSPPVGNVSWD